MAVGTSVTWTYNDSGRPHSGLRRRLGIQESSRLAEGSPSHSKRPARSPITQHPPRKGGQGHGEVIALARRDTLGGFLEIVSSSEGVYLCDLPPCTSLLVWTLNWLYRMVIMQAPEVSVQGGVFFPEPTAARLVGSSRVPGGLLKVGWIGVGLRFELRSRDQYVVTSPVRAITRTDPPVV